MAHDSSDWSRHYDEGRGFRPLGAVAEARRTGSACYLAQSPPSPGAH
ncbi:hypothetical protein ABZ569_33775 [Streptomyces albus]